MRQLLQLAGLCIVALALLLATAAGIVISEPDAVQPAAEVGHLYWRSGTYTVELTDQPCGFTEFTLMLEEQGVPPAKASRLILAGRTFAGCWVKTMGGDVLLIDPTRDEASETPISWFRREAGV